MPQYTNSPLDELVTCRMLDTKLLLKQILSFSWTPGHTSQWNLNLNLTIFVRYNAFQTPVKFWPNLSAPQCVKSASKFLMKLKKDKLMLLHYRIPWTLDMLLIETWWTVYSLCASVCEFIVNAFPGQTNTPKETILVSWSGHVWLAVFTVHQQLPSTV